MTSRLPNTLVYDLLEVASRLAETRGRANLQQAAFRRAVSAAYYALFHALCCVCAAELVGWSKTDLLGPIYRSLDHGVARAKLKSPEAKSIDPALDEIGIIFRNLQIKRHDADYFPPTDLFKRKEVLALIGEACAAVALIEGLNSKTRLQMAILLTARSRSA